MNDAELILASTSPFRKELLGRLRLPFRTVAPSFAEMVPPEPVTPERVRAATLENARGKALSLRAEHPFARILASDQLGECGGVVLDKPRTVSRALEQLRFLAGKEHRLHTAVALLDAGSGVLRTEVVESVLRVRHLPDSDFLRYIELEQPLQSAGSYVSEGLGIVLFDYVRGDDPTAVIGLPLIATCRLLEASGVLVLPTAGA